MEYSGQSGLQFRIKEPISQPLKFAGIHPLAAEQKRIRHFAERHSQRETRRGKNRGPVQNASESGSKLHILHGSGRHGIGHSAEKIRFQREANDSDDIFQGDPGHPLAAGTDFSSQTQTKRERDTGKGSSTPGENDPESQNDDARSEFRGARRLRFPIGGELSEKIAPCRTRLGQFLVAAISVEANGRCGDEDSRRLAKLAE